MITIDFKLRQAAVIRDTLFRSTAQDSYEFPSERTVEIREAIKELDILIEEALKNETADT